MIDLLSVKLNKDYDYVQDEVPNASGTWLCSDDLTGYTKGYSYQVTDDDTTRIETKQDYLINKKIYYSISMVCNYLNNYFPVYRQTEEYSYDTSDSSLNEQTIRLLYKYLSAYNEFTFSNNIISGIISNPFITNDLVLINNSLRNNYFSYVTAYNSTSITVDNTLFNNTTEYALISLVNLPDAVQEIISQMIYYDIYLKDTANNLQSESIGSYSYSKATAQIGSLYYPPEIVTGLQAYKMARFV